MNDTRGFYDDLAEDYHRMFVDWDGALDRQAAIFDRFTEAPDQRILDCACGIGTQAIGLARRGHRVVGGDLSPGSVRRAAREAADRGVRLDCAAADMCALPFPDAAFDLVLSADNAVAHLLTADRVRAALREQARVLRPGGRVVLTLRDYARLRAERPTATPPQISTMDGRRDVTVQLWHWHADGEHYDQEYVQIHDLDGERRVRVRRATSWALTAEELTAIARDAGLTAIDWHDPAETGFYQPIMTARAG